jgi:hypothetical protein
MTMKMTYVCLGVAGMWLSESHGDVLPSSEIVNTKILNIIILLRSLKINSILDYFLLDSILPFLHFLLPGFFGIVDSGGYFFREYFFFFVLRLSSFA